MKKKVIKTIIFILIMLVAGIIGFFLGKDTYEKPTREVFVGYQDTVNTNAIIYDKKITDTESQSIIDNITMILLTMAPTVNASVNLSRPDVFIRIDSPKEGICLLYSKVWFTGEGAVIGMCTGRGLEEIKFYTVDKISSQYLKEYIGYKK